MLSIIQIVFASLHPPVGVFIALLALLGVLVPLIRERIGKREKALWTIVMFVLVGLELRSISLDHIEQLEARKKEDDRFRQIADGVKKTVTTGQKQFEATMTRMEHLSSLQKSNIDAVTGGTATQLSALCP